MIAWRDHARYWGVLFFLWAEALFFHINVFIFGAAVLIWFILNLDVFGVEVIPSAHDPFANGDVERDDEQE